MKISLLAPVDLLTGYGNHCLQLAHWLPKLGIDLVIRPVSFTENFGAKNPADVKALVHHGENDCEWEILLHPLGLAPTPGKRTIYFSMCESTRLKPEHVSLLNRAEIVVVPSQWCATVFSACGVTRPIVVIPLGASDVWSFDAEFPEVFTFACAGRHHSGPNRKSVRRIWELFDEAFPTDEGVRLKAKIMPSCPSIGTWSDGRFAVTRQWMPESELREWIADCNCFINLSTGGFELFPLQAMRTGRPVISLAYGGITEYFNERNGIAVAHHMVPAKDAWTGLGDWAEADSDAVIAAMRYVRNMHLHDLEAIGIEAMRTTRHLTWENHCKRLADLVKEVARPATVVIASPVKPESEELTVCITNYKRARQLQRAIRSCVDAGIKRVVVASMEPDEEVTEIMEFWVGLGPDHDFCVEWITLPVDLGCAELWLQAAYRSKTERLIILHDDDFLDPSFGEEYVKRLSPAMHAGNMVTWLGRNIWDNGRTAEARYFGDAATGEYSVEEFHKILLDPIRLSLSPIVTIFRKTPLINALKEAIKNLTKPESFWHPEMQLGTEIVAHYRNSQQAKKWFYFGEVLSCYGTHEGSGTMLATKRGELPFLKAGYNIARDYCRNNPAPAKAEPRIIFTYSDYHATGEDKRRNDYAISTWEPHFNTGDMLRVPVWDESLTRTSANLGDPKPVPYLKDVIARGMELAQEEDIIVFANRDICLTTGAAQRIIDGVKRGGGVALAVRHNIHRPIRNKIYRSVLHCPSDNGFDLFAFTPQWWRTFSDMIPDMLIGREVWDACFRWLAEEHNGKHIFMEDVTYHEFHESFWIKERVTNPGQLWNRKLGREFFAQRVNHSDPIIKNAAQHIMWLLDDGVWLRDSVTHKLHQKPSAPHELPPAKTL